jgi:hypothetical protein
MFTIQILIALAVAVGVGAAWTIAFTAAGAIWRRDQAHAAKAPRPATIPEQHPANADDARELVLR